MCFQYLLRLTVLCCPYSETDPKRKTMKTAFRALALLLALVTINAYAEKIPDSAWHTGTLRELNSTERSGFSGGYYGGMGGMSTWTITTLHFVVVDDQYNY